MISHIHACTHKNTYITFIQDNNLHLKFNLKFVILHINCRNFFMDVCYSNTCGTLKQILLFYLNYIVIKIGISCFFFFVFERKE